MTYHVHLYNVGQDPETAFDIIRSDIPLDKLILLNNRNPEYVEVENIIRAGYEQFPIEVEVANINPWDYHDVFNKVIDLYRKECGDHGDVRFHINFTRGTRIAVGAVCSAAYSINADLYYIQEKCYAGTDDDKLIRIEIENLDELIELKSKTKIMKTFLKFRDNKSKTNRDLCGTMSPSALAYHTSQLQKIGLIEREDSVRNTRWILTEKGKQFMNRLRSTFNQNPISRDRCLSDGIAGSRCIGQGSNDYSNPLFASSSNPSSVCGNAQ